MEGLTTSRWIISTPAGTDADAFERFLLRQAFVATNRATLTRVTRNSMQSLARAEGADGSTHYLWGLHLDLMNSVATERIVAGAASTMRSQLEAWDAHLSEPLTGVVLDESDEEE